MANVLVERDGHVTVLTLNRPEKLNAFTSAMIDELNAAMGEFRADPDQYVAVITGAGRAFSAGFDLGEMSTQVSARNQDVGVTSVDIWGVGDCPKPTIAAVNGLAVAGGFELCLNCDIRMAAEDAWFGLAEVKRGIMAGVGVNMLARYLPFGEALYLLMTAERLEASEAHRLGLVQRLFGRDELLDRVMETAALICANSQVAVQASKRVAYFWRNLAVREQLDYYKAVNQQLMLCDDVVEGTRAFVEKRSPQFANRWPVRESPCDAHPESSEGRR